MIDAALMVVVIGAVVIALAVDLATVVGWIKAIVARRT
jgi:hypothetical protein